MPTIRLILWPRFYTSKTYLRNQAQEKMQGCRARLLGAHFDAVLVVIVIVAGEVIFKVLTGCDTTHSKTPTDIQITGLHWGWVGVGMGIGIGWCGDGAEGLGMPAVFQHFMLSSCNPDFS